jgi:hypothetical protein
MIILKRILTRLIKNYVNAGYKPLFYLVCYNNKKLGNELGNCNFRG